jgi:hypothetical protein
MLPRHQASAACAVLGISGFASWWRQACYICCVDLLMINAAFRHLPAVATNNLYAALLREASSSTSRKVAAECVKKLDAFMERSGEHRDIASASPLWQPVFTTMCATSDSHCPWNARNAGGVLRLKQNLESRLGRPQQEALLTSYGVAALLANKNDIAKEAIRCGNCAVSWSATVACSAATVPVQCDANQS